MGLDSAGTAVAETSTGELGSTFCSFLRETLLVLDLLAFSLLFVGIFREDLLFCLLRVGDFIIGRLTVGFL